MQILIAEDFAQFRELVTTTLEANFQVKPTSVSDGLQAIEKATQLQPDLVLLDIGLPKLSGIEVARQIRKISPHSKILFVSMLASPAVIDEALRNGQGYVLKTDVAMELVTAIRAVLNGERFISRTLISRIPGISLVPPIADENLSD